MEKSSNTCLRYYAAIMIIALCILVFNNAFAKNKLYFDVENIAQWQHKKFNGMSEYQLTRIDGKKAIVASSKQSASALYNKTSINLDATPYLNWTWRVEEFPDTNADDNTKNGDDYAARIYVVFKTGFAFWDIASLNYVWANQRPADDHWFNAYTNKVVMLAVESGSESRGQWQSYKHNVTADIKKYLGKDISKLSSIAIMTDSDDSKSQTKSYYGDIWFSAE